MLHYCLLFHTVSCEYGKFATQMDHSRIVNGKAFSESISVCEPCPLGTLAENIGSSTCQQCPKYHTTQVTGAASKDECIREL